MSEWQPDAAFVDSVLVISFIVVLVMKRILIHAITIEIVVDAVLTMYGKDPSPHCRTNTGLDVVGKTKKITKRNVYIYLGYTIDSGGGL